MPVIVMNIPSYKLWWAAVLCILLGLIGAAVWLCPLPALSGVQAATPPTISTPTSEPVQNFARSSSARALVVIQSTSIVAPRSEAPPAVAADQVMVEVPVKVENNQIILDRFCRQVPFPDWQYAADQLPLLTDLSQHVRDQLQVLFRPSCNVEPGNQPQAVVVHFTRGDTLEGAVAALRSPQGPSAHYVIDRDGTVVQMVPERLVAAHVSCNTGMPSCLALRSIGIELVNRGQVNPQFFTGPIYEDYQMSFGWRWWEDYPEAQIHALQIVTQDISQRWGIPMDSAHILGHYRVNQKADPGPALNLFWRRFGQPGRPAIFGVEK